MLYCDKCKKPLERQFTCGFCGGLFCNEHKILKNHACISISPKPVDSMKTENSSKAEAVQKPLQVKKRANLSRKEKSKVKLKPVDYLGLSMIGSLLLALLFYFSKSQIGLVFVMITAILFISWVIGMLINEAAEKESKKQRCSRCGKAEMVLMICYYCGLKFCFKHLSPENHNCGRK